MAAMSSNKLTVSGSFVASLPSTGQSSKTSSRLEAYSTVPSSRTCLYPCVSAAITGSAFDATTASNSVADRWLTTSAIVSNGGTSGDPWAASWSDMARAHPGGLKFPMKYSRTESLVSAGRHGHVHSGDHQDSNSQNQRASVERDRHKYPENLVPVRLCRVSADQPSLPAQATSNIFHPHVLPGRIAFHLPYSQMINRKRHERNAAPSPKCSKNRAYYMQALLKVASGAQCRGLVNLDLTLAMLSIK